MLKELMDKLQEMAVATVRPIVLPPNPLLPNKLLVSHGQTIDVLPSEPASRSGTTLGSLEDFVAFVADKNCAPDPEVYFEATRLVVLTDRKMRRELAVCHLLGGQRWLALERLAATSGSAFDVRGAVKYLRYVLGAPDNVITPLSRIDFSRKSAGAASAEHGKESFGMSVEMAAQQADSIPKDFFLSVEPFTTMGARIVVQVECSVYIDLAAQKIELGVKPDEMAHAIDFAVDAVGQLLRTAVSTARPGVPVFRGCQVT